MSVWDLEVYPLSRVFPFVSFIRSILYQRFYYRHQYSEQAFFNMFVTVTHCIVDITLCPLSPCSKWML